MFEHAAKLGFEGIISKKADAPYRSGRSEAWVKVKCAQRARFPVVGFVKDPTGVAALHLARKEGRDHGLHGQGRHRLVAHGLKPDSEATRHRRLAEIQADEAAQGAEGHMG